ncbi:MAG: aldo/keto reductase [Polyangiales bacterium]
MSARWGLGLAALGRPGYITLGHAQDLADGYAVEVLERRTHAVLDEAWAAGVRWFDAARSYGRAEVFLASWLAARRIAAAEVTVSSKWGYTYVADWRVDASQHEVKDHTLATLERQLGESRALLGGHLALYQIHSATLESGVLDDQAVVSRLTALRDAGLEMGLSLSGPKQGETLLHALALRPGGRPLWAAVQATWNLLERSAEPALRAAKAAGLRVLLKETLANGRLTPRAAPPPLLAAAAELGATPDAVALAAALAQPFADIVLVGPVTPAQLASNLAACGLADRSLPGDLASLRQDPTHYWQARSALPWN